ncbi:MAG: ATP-grasp domain-containing protein [Clostridium sp.]|uniref:ATP-grasp domain-containing protein n=1 Tax=Clostridium sp. TaxID=1506 RepID=UPI003F2F4441
MLLRDFCKKCNIPHPRFEKIDSLEELKYFYKGSDIIFKPTNRQASLGISKISSEDEIGEAWKYTTKAEESKKQVIKRNFKEEFIAEEYIDGYEVSVESFVQNGKSIFKDIQ